MARKLPDDDTVDELASHLEREAVQVAGFVDILDREAGMLGRTHELQELQALTREKSTAAESLEQNEQRRHMLLKRMGVECEYEESEWDALLRSHPALSQPWGILLNSIRQAAEGNRRNGAILQVYLQHASDVLEHLKATRQQQTLYDARGRRR